MTLLLPKGLAREIRVHAEEGYPNEVCGFLIGAAPRGSGDRAVRRVRRAPNTFEGNRRTRFQIHPREIIALEDELGDGEDQILGFYHSHPDYPAAPSLHDQEQAWPWYSYVVASVVAGRFGHLTSWRLTEDRLRFDEENVVLR